MESLPALSGTIYGLTGRVDQKGIDVEIIFGHAIF